MKMTLKDFLGKLQLLVTGNLSEDEMITILTELEEDKKASDTVKTSKVADFFNRNDEKPAEDSETVSEEETHEEDAVKDDEEHIDDLFEDESEDVESEVKDEE